MRIPLPRTTLTRIAAGACLLIIVAACSSSGSSGCAGCAGSTTIPGGFPASARMDNGAQVRLSQGGMTFLEQNLSSLITTLVPGGLSFAIPPTGCSSSTKVCCNSGAKCKADITLSKTTLTPTPSSTIKAKIDAIIKTSKMQVSAKVLFTFTCDIAFDSTKSNPSTVGLATDVDLVVQANNQNKMAVKMGDPTISNFDTGDLKVSGSAWYCTVGDFLLKVPGLNTLIENEVKKQLKSTMNTALNTALKDLPLGQESRMDVGTLLASVSPRTTGIMDYSIWAGGHAKAEQSGMSIGAMAGFVAPTHNPCVPDCSKPAGKCSKPQKTAISWSTSFKGNKRPDGKDFHVGIGLHRQALDHAAYAFYDSGGLCLDIGSSTVPQLTSSIFTLLLPSLKTLTEGKNTPLVLAIRPRKPPTITLGKGTYTTDSKGVPTITEPLLNLKAKDLAIDLYLMGDERYFRAFTIVTDMEIPVLLYANSKNQLQPMIGDLTKALSNIRLENNELMTEKPSVVTGLLPTLISMASGMLGDAIAPIDLPAVSGIKLILDSGSITSVDKNSTGYEMLAIFAKLGISKTSSPAPSPSPAMPDPRPPVETLASIDTFIVPPTDGFRLRADGNNHGPTLILSLDAVVPPEHAGKQLEFAYRVDGGLYRSWTSARLLTINDPLFMVQGRHTVEVMARVAGEYMTLDPTPEKIQLLIDTVAPTAKLVRTSGGVKVVAEDMVASTTELQVSWSVGGGPFSDYGRQLDAAVPEGVEVAVRVKDPAGNVTTASLASDEAWSEETPDDLTAGGCQVGGVGQNAGTLLPLLGLLLLGWRRRR